MSDQDRPEVRGRIKRSDDIADDPEVRSMMRRLDGMIPEGMDRRSFFKSALAFTTGSALAGCMGDGDNEQTATTTQQSTTTQAGGGGGTGTAGSPPEMMARDTRFWNSWKKEIDWSIAYVANGRGFWEDAGVNLRGGVSPGYGSGDGGKRVGTGKETMAVASIVPQISGWAQGLEMFVFGTGRVKANQGMLWRPDRMDSPTDLAGKRIATTSSLNEQMFNNIWMGEVATEVDPSNVELQVTDQSTAFVLMAQGEVDAIFQTVDAISQLRSVFEDRGVNAEIRAELLYNHVPLLSYVLLVNSNFIQQNNNVEFMSRVLEGYSHATKWVMFNPEKAVQYMQQNVNEALQAQSTQDLVDTINASIVAQNLGVDFYLNKGICSVTEDTVETNMETLAGIFDNVTEAPTLENTLTLEPQEKADLAQLSQSEHQQLIEQAQPYSQYYID